MSNVWLLSSLYHTQYAVRCLLCIIHNMQTAHKESVIRFHEQLQVAAVHFQEPVI